MKPEVEENYFVITFIQLWCQLYPKLVLVNQIKPYKIVAEFISLCAIAIIFQLKLKALRYYFFGFGYALQEGSI